MKIILTLFFSIVFAFCNAQNTSTAPTQITRNIKQDHKGNIWMATWEGAFRYDGKLFINMTAGVSTARFFSVMEDSKGNVWLGTIGSGVFLYDGTFFKNFTTKDGLVNNEVGEIYEDRAGNIWLGLNGGVSRYDGKSFRNYMMDGDAMAEEKTGKTFPDFTRPPYEVTSILEDKSGKFWFSTRRSTFVYDGKTFSIFKNSDGKPFTNVRCIIQDRRGNIWLAGNDGLWRYDGKTLTSFSHNFVGYVYEDRQGNILISSGNGKSTGQDWEIYRYSEKSLDKYSSFINLPEIIKANEVGTFGILEARDGSIWFGTANGARRFDGSRVEDFRK